MKTNDIALKMKNQENISDTQEHPKRIITREEIEERQRIAREKARLVWAQEVSSSKPIPRANLNDVEKRLLATKQVARNFERLYQSLPPKAKQILELLINRSPKWACQRFNQSWIARTVGCSLRWVNDCIGLLARCKFIEIKRTIKGRALYINGAFKTPPNIYVVLYWWKWSVTQKMYETLLAQAERNQKEFLQYQYMFNKQYNISSKGGYYPVSGRELFTPTSQKRGGFLPIGKIVSPPLRV